MYRDCKGFIVVKAESILLLKQGEQLVLQMKVKEPILVKTY